MTMPAIAPPERPVDVSCSEEVKVMFAPVATGVSNGTVVVGARVLVTTRMVDDVAAKGALAATPPTTVVAVTPAEVKIVVYVE